MSEPVHLLALDPARCMGLARWRAGEDVWSGTQRFDADDLDGRLAEVMTYLTAKLRWFRDNGRPVTHGYCEAAWANPARMGASSDIFEMQGVIRAVFAREDVPLTFVTAQAWRKTFLGKGRATGKRADMKRFAIERCRALGIEPKSNDEADAAGLLFHARCLHDGAFAASSTDLFASRRAA